jgi:AraC-like DNA-binding protein
VSAAQSATVSAGFAKALVDFAVSKGADEAPLLAAVGLCAEDFADADRRVPFDRFVALMRAAKTLCNDPAFALEFGAAGDYRRVSIVGLIAYASATMAEALTQINRYGRLILDVAGIAEGARFEIVHEKGERWMIDHRADPNSFPELTEATFSRFICTTRRDFPQAVYALSAEVTHPAPSYRDAYERLWQVPVRFDAARNAIQTTTDWGDVQIQPNNRYVFGVFTERGDKLLLDLEAQTTLRGRVESLILPLLHTGDVSINTVAGKLDTSRQTLHRNLKSEGVTFEQVLDELRHKMALDYLKARKVSVNETAYLVGFSDPAAFSRAFKRWTGVSPREARGLRS